MKIVPSIEKHCRMGGGLFVGVRLNFPCNIWDFAYSYKSVILKFGFVFFTVNIEFRYDIKEKIRLY